MDTTKMLAFLQKPGVPALPAEQPQLELWMNGKLTGGQDQCLGVYLGSTTDEAYRAYVRAEFGGILPAYAQSDCPQLWSFKR